MKSIIETVKSYVYDLDEHKLMSDSYSLLSGIGYEYRTEHHGYSIDCMNAPRNECTFQYTISGEGAVTINKKTHLLRPGQGFLVEKPGQFRYFVPRRSEHWEFKWIALNLPSIRYWKEITDNYGRIIEIDSTSLAMQYWETIYELAAKSAIGDVFMSSAHAYTFIMNLHHDLSTGRQSSNETQDIFQHCLHSIHERYSDPDFGLNTLAEELQVSVSYLSRLFKDHMKETYIRYLTAHRMNAAAELLVSTNLPIDVIAGKVGLPDANYFARVFRKNHGLSPSQYRQQYIGADHSPAVQAESIGWRLGIDP